MTVTSSSIATVFLGNGSTKDFSTDFQFWDAGEIEVCIRTTATGALEKLVLDTNYIVTGGVGQFGAVDVALRAQPPTASETIHIIRVSNLSQNIDLTPAVDFPTATVEQGLDRDALRIQESKNASGTRSMVIPLTDMDTAGDFPNMALPDKAVRGVANAILGFNSSGEPIILVTALPTTPGTTTFGTDWVQLADAAAARANIDAAESVGNSVDNLQIGTELERAAITAANGEGFFVTTDEGKFWYSDGSSWVILDAIRSLPIASLDPGGTLAGALQIDTDNLELLRDSGSVLEPLQAPWIKGSINGLLFHNNTGSPNTEISVGAGECRAHLGLGLGRNLVHAVMTKLTSTGDVWVAGTGNAGNAKFADITGNEWFYIFIVANDVGTTDIAFDTSSVGTNILDVSGKIALAGYTEHIRRIGRFQTNGSDFIKGIQSYPDGWVSIDAPEIGFNATADFSPGLTVDVDGAPPDSLCRLSWWTLQTLDNASIFTEKDQDNTVPSITVGPGSIVDGAGADSAGMMLIRTNASSEIRFRSVDTSNTLRLSCHGWYDDRAKDE